MHLRAAWASGTRDNLHLLLDLGASEGRLDSQVSRRDLARTLCPHFLAAGAPIAPRNVGTAPRILGFRRNSRQEILGESIRLQPSPAFGAQVVRDCSHSPSERWAGGRPGGGPD